MPGGKKPGSSVKWPELYEKLRAEGKSKESAARISNAAARKRKAKKLKKHRPGGQEHNQEEHGNWAQGTSGRQLAERVRDQGGFTIDPITGEIPERGFAVAIKAHESIHTSAHPRIFSDYIRANQEQWAKGYKLGGWYKQSTGELFLDVVEVFDDGDYTSAFTHASQRGMSEKQEAIFDLANFEEIAMTQSDVDAYRARLNPDGSLTDAAA